MAAVTMKKSSFSRTPSSTSSSFSPNNTPPGIKRGLNNTTFISSGIPDLDNILGGGFQLGSLVMVMEDPEAPHHLLLLRNFMSQGLVHDQHLLYASPFKDPKAFLGTLPNPISPKDNKKVSRFVDPDQEKGLRIAWQYMKYFGEDHQNADNHKDTKKEYCNEFDLRKPLDRQFLSAQRTHCISIQESPSLAAFCDQCSSFLAQVPRKDGGIGSVGRIAIQSLCAPQCGYSNMEWDMLSLIRSLKSMLRSSNAVAVITFPSSLLSPSSSKRWQHLADTLLSVRAVPDEDKDMAKLLTGYQDMVGFLHVHKVSQINTQVPVILEAHTYSMKLERRKTLVLERLNQAPVDGSSGPSYNTSSGCSSSSKAAAIDF